MNPPINDDSNYESASDKRFAAAATRKLPTHFVHFMDPNHLSGFINLEPEIIGKLQIGSEDAFVEEIVPEGILLRRVTQEREQ